MDRLHHNLSGTVHLGSVGVDRVVKVEALLTVQKIQYQEHYSSTARHIVQLYFTLQTTIYDLVSIFIPGPLTV